MNAVQEGDTFVNVPSVGSMVIMNMWSNGGPFSGVMAPGGEGWLDLKWIELVFNTTASGGNEGLGTVCDVESSPGELVPVF